jgi:hypothetical protein
MKFIPLIILLAGGGIMIYALGSYAGHALPYQDPTHELIEIQHTQLQTAKFLAVIGAIFIVAGGIWWFSKSSPKPRSSDSQKSLSPRA